MSVTFEYGNAPISKFGVETRQDSKRKTVATNIILPDGRKVAPTKRFWQSLQMRFRFSTNIFKYFPHVEMFDRISKVSPNDMVRYCTEEIKTADGNIHSRMLAVTNPAKPVITYDNLVNILGRYNSSNINYSDGFIRSSHVPKMNAVTTLGGDSFENRFIVDTPIDGFGRPSVYLSMLRQVCANGMVGYAPAFRSELTVGKKNDSIEFSLERALDGFNNEEGYSAIQDRILSAQSSWASVNEAMTLQRTVHKAYQMGGLIGVQKLVISEEGKFQEYQGIPIMRDLMKLTGDLNQHYGLSNLDTLSNKRQRTLPAGCKVYDLLNFASEVATHHSHPNAARHLQAFIGSILSNEYDLEGTCDRFSDWKDFFVEDENAKETFQQLEYNGAGS